MPHPYPTRPRTDLTVPVTILLPPPHTPAPSGRRSRGLSAHAAREIITWYTARGEPVADLDRDPVVAAAVGDLRRRLRAVDPDPAADGKPARRCRLVIARLPRPGVSAPRRVTAWMRQVHQRLLAPGGHLVTVLAPGGAGLRLAGHAGVVACAHDAGLVYQQQLIDIPRRPDEHEPAAEPATAPGVSVRLAGGRHRPAHREIYVFTTGGRR